MSVESLPLAELSGTEVVALYEARIRAVVEPADIGKFIAVDVATSDFFVADEYLDAAHEALDRYLGASSRRHQPAPQTPAHSGTDQGRFHHD